ncbi:hypothetical protein B0H14DRAFT_2643067 [Mycena olivaceomarginata]|nr:hypothetical protein B0H14DRAFT_2643067 [Mycena olivaceomarginata]
MPLQTCARRAPDEPPGGSWWFIAKSLGYYTSFLMGIFVSLDSRASLFVPRIHVIPPLASLLPHHRPTTSSSGVRQIVWLSFKCTVQVHMGCTATLFPAVPTASISPAGAQDPLQPGKAPKHTKKGGEKELNLDWELVAGGKYCFSRVQLSKSERKIGVEDGYTVSTPRMTKINGTGEYQKQH